MTNEKEGQDIFMFPSLETDLASKSHILSVLLIVVAIVNFLISMKNQEAITHDALRIS